MTEEPRSLFKLAPPDIDESKIAPALRKEVRALRDMEPSHKVIYDMLTEDQFHYPFRVECGIVRKAKIAVARACSICTQTVLEAARDFERRRLVYTKTYWEGIGEITYWYIVGLAQKHELKAAYDECTGRLLRMSKRPPRTRDADGKFVSKKVEKQAKNKQNRLPHGLKHPSGGGKLASKMDQGSVTGGLKQPAGTKVSPRRWPLQSTPMARLVHAGGGESPQSKNVSIHTVDSNTGGSTPPRKGKEGEIDREDGFEEWRAGLKKQFPRELKELLGDLNQQRKGGDPDGRIGRKVDAVMVALYGPGSTNSTRKASKPAPTAAPSAPMTAAEIQSSKAYLEANGMKDGAAYRHLVALEQT